MAPDFSPSLSLSRARRVANGNYDSPFSQNNHVVQREIILVWSDFRRFRTPHRSRSAPNLATMACDQSLLFDAVGSSVPPRPIVNTQQGSDHQAGLREPPKITQQLEPPRSSVQHPGWCMARSVDYFLVLLLSLFPLLLFYYSRHFTFVQINVLSRGK